jgi:hypothetical protein
MRTRVLMAGIFAMPLLARAATLTVAPTGVDGPGCGVGSTPCRSISQGIVNAVDGDRIQVRPGVYSDDLDNDGNFGEPGEEPMAISVFKAVAIESTRGASATLIRKKHVPSGAVDIIASGARFGKPGKGFTVVVPGGSNSTGISVINAVDVVVSGNVLMGPVNIGFGVTGGNPLIKDNRVVCTTNAGVAMLLVFPTAGMVIDRNAIEGCNTGITGGGPGLTVQRNLVIDCSLGFGLSEFALFTRNGAVSNRGIGLALNPGGSIGTIVKNTFAGNDPFGNCGLFNDTGTAVTATDNFWGAVTGPGPDPADQACNGAGSSTVTTPFATTDYTPAQAALR